MYILYDSILTKMSEWFVRIIKLKINVLSVVKNTWQVSFSTVLKSKLNGIQ